MIEVGDATEFAPFNLQHCRETAPLGGRERTFTVQNEAMLPWFERQTPPRSRARGSDYRLARLWLDFRRLDGFLLCEAPELLRCPLLCDALCPREDFRPREAVRVAFSPPIAEV